MALSFSEAQIVVSFVAGISVEKSETFRSRLKQWQKMGFPEGTKVGKGVKAEYGASQVLQLVLLAKLLRIGLTPERAQHVITVGWSRFKAGFVEALACMANGEQHLHYFFIQLDALSQLTSPGRSDHMHTFVDVFTEDELLLAWDEPDPEWSEDETKQHKYLSFLVKNRMAVSITIEIDSLFLFIWAALDALNKGPEIFADEFATWVVESRHEEAMFQESKGHFDNDTFNQSVALRADDMDRRELARLSLPKDSDNVHP